jgi:cob(I)alamin adenosyltransferase
MSIATRTGDTGSTSLLFGRRVSKADARIAANGAIDELNAALGMARALARWDFVREPILAIQRELVGLMGEIACEEGDRDRYREKGFACIDPEKVERLTALVHELENNHRLDFAQWATPGASPAAAALDVARTVCRRAEREVVLVATETELNPEILRYLNRLSDLLWLLARWVETHGDAAHVTPQSAE